MSGQIRIPKQRTSSENAHAEEQKVDERHPSASHAEARNETPTNAELHAQENHARVVEDVEAVMAKIDMLIPAAGGIAVRAA